MAAASPIYFSNMTDVSKEVHDIKEILSVIIEKFSRLTAKISDSSSLEDIAVSMAALCAHNFATQGVTYARGLVKPILLEKINMVMRSRADRVMKLLGSRPIGIGSREGYHELVQRSPNRFDVPLSNTEIESLFRDEGRPPWLDFIHNVIGPEAEQSFAGVVFSKPGSPAQQWHIDSPHEAKEHRRAHAVNVLVALSDIPLLAGPTELALGSHKLTNHIAQPWLDREDLLYQTSDEFTPDRLHGVSDDTARCRSSAKAMEAGDCVIFDDRILHRGLGNRSSNERWVAYFSYAKPRPGNVDDTHFEATRSLFVEQSAH